MRSRYGAYALGLVDYIVQTTDEGSDVAQADPAQWRRSIADFCANTQFEGLEVLDTSQDGDRGRVTFLARLKQAGQDVSFREESEFVRRAGRWFYASGRVTPLADPGL